MVRQKILIAGAIVSAIALALMAWTSYEVGHGRLAFPFWTLNDWESIFKIGGVAGAAWFFLFKVANGFHNVNLSVQLELRRAVCTEDEDWLEVSVVLEKGTMSAMWLKAIVLRVDAGSGSVRQFRLDVGRASASTSKVRDDPQFSWPARGIGVDDRTSLIVNPGDKTQFGWGGRIPATDICCVDALVVGRRTGAKDWAQWRASGTAVPAARAPKVRERFRSI